MHNNLLLNKYIGRRLNNNNNSNIRINKLINKQCLHILQFGKHNKQVSHHNHKRISQYNHMLK